MRARARQQGARILGGLAAMASSIPGVASAAQPAILYIPDEPVTLRPLDASPCGSSADSALGCANVTDETEVPPYADAAGLAVAMAMELAPYDVLVTTERPPEYISYVMLMASLDPAPTSRNVTCTVGSIQCGARRRNDIAFTSGSTMNCMDPEVTHAALYAFGRASGLEGVANPQDYMGYVPDYTMPPTGFVNACADRVSQIGFDGMGNEVPMPLECTSLDHFECPVGVNGEPGQNSHQDLQDYYGVHTTDFEPPVLSHVVPEDGAVLPSGEPVTLDFVIDDDDPVVGARWVIASPALVEVGEEDGMLSHCTNDVCDSNWEDATPLKATSSQWRLDVVGLPDGEYTLTLEAADYHGHVADTLTMSVTIGVPGGPSGSDDTVGSATYFPANFDDSPDGSFTGSGAVDGPTASGCACAASRRGPPVGASSWLLLLAGGALRRRVPPRAPGRPR